MTEQTQGKGRPTPKRRDVEKRRGGPVAPPPATRKEAKQLRAQRAADRRAGKAPARTREPILLARDAGPVRRLVRDVVDARRNIGGLLMPAAALSVASFFTTNQQVLAAISGVFLATLLGVVMDTVLLSALLRKVIRTRFPEETKLTGHVLYGVLRSTVLRRLRMPKPAVARGTRL